MHDGLQLRTGAFPLSVQLCHVWFCAYLLCV